VATVLAGRTLILVKSNRTTGDPRRFVELVFSWDSPSSPTWSWQGAQYFGARPGDAVDQVFRVELMSVDLDAVRTARDAGDDAVNRLAEVGEPLGRVSVRRVRGTAPDDCPGP
jgi:hypothetical protein